MIRHISQSDPRTLTTQQILDEIDGFTSLAVAVVERWATLLRELAVRRVPHPMFRHPVMQFWRSIAEQELHPEAVVLLADRATGKMIRAVMPLPREQQRDVARGEPVAVATQTDTGEIKTENMPIHRMDNAMLKRAFGPDGIRTVHEQADMLRAQDKIQRIGPVTVLRDEQVLKIGNQKISPEDLKGPLMALGYSLDLIRNSPRKAG